MARHNFRNLNIWKDGLELSNDSYRITKGFPKSEMYNLVSQMNRCAVSIPSNIAEGTAKSSDKHFKIFLENSLGSCFEWETQLEIANKQGYIKLEDYNILIEKIQKSQRMVGAFIDRLS